MELSETSIDARICRFPGCERPAALGEAGSGRPPEYCDDPAHNRAAAWRARQARGSSVVEGKPDGRPVDSARQRASEIRGQVSGMIEHLEGQLRSLVGELATVGDLDAAEAQAESVASDAAEQVASAIARATRAEQAQRRAETDRADADLLTADAIERSELLESALTDARQSAESAEAARLQLTDEIASIVAATDAERDSSRLVVSGLETDLTLVRGSLAEALQDREATAARLADMTATAAGAESRATVAAAEVTAAGERAERAEAGAESLRNQVDALRDKLAAEHDRASTATSQIAVLTIERDNALTAAVREREYADQRVADLRATDARQSQETGVSGEGTTGTATPSSPRSGRTKTKSIDQADS